MGGEVVDNRGKQAGNFSPVSKIELPEYFQQGKGIKALVGWHGLVVRDHAVNIIELCLEHMKYVQKSSCGKCFPCRVGSQVMTSVLGRISDGTGCKEDLELLKELGTSIKASSKCGIGQSGPIPVLDALQYFKKSFADAVKNSTTSPKDGYSYCSKLTAPCMDACPIHLDIPAYVESIGEGDFKKSLDIIREKLPIPGVVGRVCVRPCEAKCRRGLMDDPISIKYLKRFVADYEISRDKLQDYPVQTPSKNGKVAIVGAGPSGVTCAYHLAQKGYHVTIYEALEEPGGMAAVGIPDYRLPRNILRDEVERIQKMGVEIKYGMRVGRDITLNELEENNDAVFIAIGAHLSLNMGVKGENEGYKGFISGVQYLKDINEGRDPYPEGKKVVVIGGGNVAIDCIRTSYRVNKTDVNLVYRRTKKEMPADPVEIRDAEEEGVNFLYLTNPTKVIAENGKVTGLECIRMELGEPDASGRRRPVPVLALSL
jgi:formate dehydrogenase (NADP+) beta subunit